jgi:hypothetical protein
MDVPDECFKQNEKKNIVTDSFRTPKAWSIFEQMGKWCATSVGKETLRLRITKIGGNGVEVTREGASCIRHVLCMYL